MPLPFSTSQQQLIRLLAEGYADSEIARKTALTPSGRRDGYAGAQRRVQHSNGGGQMATDPVCNMQVDKADAEFTTQYDGKTYYFCSDPL